MADVTHLKIDDIDGFNHSSGEMSLRKVQQALGVSSFGIAVVELGPETDVYPEHHHDGEQFGQQADQEEVFLALGGGGEIEVDGKRYPLDPGHIVRVGPKPKRKVYPGGEGMRLLVIGGTPGKPYEAR
ncbi:MAG TPA: hypothetical protein VIF43_02555 [Patescibacteria group bacterium]|jgi:uncharacterized cupin superfamily protein